MVIGPGSMVGVGDGGRDPVGGSEVEAARADDFAASGSVLADPSHAGAANTAVTTAASARLRVRTVPADCLGPGERMNRAYGHVRPSPLRAAAPPSAT